MKKITISAVMLLSVVLLCACGAATEETLQLESEMAVSNISTPYAELFVPASFDGNVVSQVVNEDPYTLLFAASDGTELFSLIFNGTGDVLMGTLEGSDNNTVIYMNFADLDEKSENYKTYANYQESVNTIIQNLSEDYEFHVNEIVEKDAGSTIGILTPTVMLEYPAKWKDIVSIFVEGNRVEFVDQRDDTPLFDLVFGELDGEGFLLGTYDSTPIYIVDYEVKREDQMAMIEDVNVIIDNLKNDSKFKMSN